MKSLSTYKLFILLIFGSCANKIIISKAPTLGGTWTVENDIKKNISSKKTGTYRYPNLGTEYTLKNGKFNGAFKIISKNSDTIFYSNYKNNLPIGKYLSKRLDYNEKVINHRSVPVRPKLDYGIGSGKFNQDHKKDGIWDEDGKTIIYKDGNIISSN